MALNHCNKCGHPYDHLQDPYCPHSYIVQPQAPTQKFDRPVTIGSSCNVCKCKITQHEGWREVPNIQESERDEYLQSLVCPPTAKPRGGHPRFYDLVAEITALHNRKNTDYAAGTKEGPLGNFHRVSAIKQLYPGFDWDSPFGVAMGYMLKQLDAAFTLRSQKRESVTGEPVRERLKDVAVYSLIGMIIEEEEHGPHS